MRTSFQAGLSSLTSFECLAAFFFCAGFSDGEIAGRLGITESDVEDTIAEVLAKLGLPDRPALETFIAKQIRGRSPAAVGKKGRGGESLTGAMDYPNRRTRERVRRQRILRWQDAQNLRLATTPRSGGKSSVLEFSGGPSRRG